MTWIDRVLDGKNKERHLRDRSQRRQDIEREKNVSLSWRAWLEVGDAVRSAVDYFNERVPESNRILLNRENEREIEVSHKRRPSLRLHLVPESRSIKCEMAYREKGWDSDTLYLQKGLTGFSLTGRDGKRSLTRSIKRWLKKFLEDILL
jgi:hypothetical protein